MTYKAPSEAAETAHGDNEEPSGDEFKWPGVERLLDGVLMCRSVSLYAMRGWFDAEVDLAVTRADHHGWDHNKSTDDAVDRLRATLHVAVDTLAELKLAAGAEGRIQ